MQHEFRQKRGLGRGLSALFGDEQPKEKSNLKKVLSKVSISDLSRNPFQPREIFNEGKMDELAASIKKNGVIQPIAVRPSKSESGKFEIVAGERRWIAAQKAGLHEIPVNVLDLSDVESLEVAIVENIQRDDLNPVEEARGFKRLSDEFQYDHESISKLMSKSRRHISNTLRLLNLTSDVISMLEEGSLSSGQARPLVGLSNASNIAEEVVAKNYSARKVEYLVKSKKVKKDKSYDANVLKAQERIEKKLGLKVYVTNKKNNSGRVIIEYKDLEQFDLISDLLTKN